MHGDGSMQLFLQDISSRPADPALSVSAQLERINLEVLRKFAPLQGLLDGQISLSGTLGKPIGNLAARVPALQVQDTQLRICCLMLSSGQAR